MELTNESIADYYVPYHPAVLRALKKIVDAGAEKEIPVSICGDLASDPNMLPFLIGIGLKHVSADVRQMRKVQRAISMIDRHDAARLADQMLSLGRISDLNTLMEAGPKTF